MGNTTERVRVALNALGWDAPEKVIKAYLLEREPEVSQGQIGLALRKIRAAGMKRTANLGDNIDLLPFTETPNPLPDKK